MFVIRTEEVWGMGELTKLSELFFSYGGSAGWGSQMQLLLADPVMHLEEYRHLPEGIRGWKDDERLAAAMKREELERLKVLNHEGENRRRDKSPCCLAVGIGTYKTTEDGELYMCALLDRNTRKVMAYSFGVHRSAELVGKALENYFELYGMESGAESSLLSSQNPLYRSREYQELLKDFAVKAEMTQKGSRGQAAVVSTYFSQLMRRKGCVIFRDWQDAVDWLTMDILSYNLKLKEA